MNIWARGVRATNTKQLPVSDHFTFMVEPWGCKGGSGTEPTEGWERKDVDLVGVRVAGSPIAVPATKDKSVCGQYRPRQLMSTFVKTPVAALTSRTCYCRLLGLLQHRIVSAAPEYPLWPSGHTNVGCKCHRL
jgi:hypothetical protein